MAMILSSEKSVHMLTTRRCIPEDGNIHNYHWKNLGFYKIRDEYFYVA
jgi:hypothetical protein